MPQVFPELLAGIGVKGYQSPVYVAQGSGGVNPGSNLIEPGEVNVIHRIVSIDAGTLGNGGTSTITVNVTTLGRTLPLLAMSVPQGLYNSYSATSIQVDCDPGTDIVAVGSGVGMGGGTVVIRLMKVFM